MVLDSNIAEARLSEGNFIFNLSLSFILLSFSTLGFENSLFGITMFTDVSTLFVYLTFLTLVFSGKVRIGKFLAILYLFVFFQTFIVNFPNTFLVSTLKQYIGLILFSITLFSFISVYRYRIVNIIQIYYKFVLILAGIGILQCVFFTLFGFTFKPQNLISGKSFGGGVYPFSHEIIGLLPRVVGLSTEPAHYAVLMLPGVYISLLVLVGKAGQIGIHGKSIAKIILIGFVLSFSMVGFFGLALCLLSVFSGSLKGKLLPKISIFIFFIGLLFFMSKTDLSSKITTLPSMVSNIENFDYTSSDLTGFALVSNLIVAREGLIKSNFIGTGLNSHIDTYNQVIYKLFSNSQVVFELNKENAGSLFIRLPSEFGILGLISFIVFLFYYHLGKKDYDSPYKLINNMVLVILISFAFRNGEYINVFFWLFVALYYYTYKITKNIYIDNAVVKN
jgi:hypothetical protein